MSVYNDNEFDAMMRSMLADGEMPPPEGMWDNITARLDAEAAPRRRWLWIPALFAGVACAVVAAVLIVGNRQNGITPQASTLVAQAIPETNVTEETLAEEPGIEYRTEQEFGSAAQPAPAFRAETVIGQEEHPALDDKTEPSTRMAEGQTDNHQADTQEDASNAQDGTRNSKDATEGIRSSYTVADTDDWTEPEILRSRRFPVDVQLVALGSTGGNLGRHKYSVGRSASSAIDFGSRGKVTEEECTFTAIPVCIGVGLKVTLNDRWAIGAGLTYTYLGRRFSGKYDSGAIEKYDCESISNSQHYLGIPINFYFKFAQTEKLQFYALAGGTFEKCMSNSYMFDYAGSPMYLDNKVKGFQISVTLGAGLQYQLSRLIGIYIDPEFKYYFKNSYQPKSIRTTQPFQLGCEAGVRFNL